MNQEIHTKHIQPQKDVFFLSLILYFFRHVFAELQWN